MVRARVVVGGLVALLVLAGASLVPGSAAGAAEVSIGFTPWGGDRYVRPGIGFTDIEYCLGAQATVDVEVRDAEGGVVRDLMPGTSRPATSCLSSPLSVRWDLQDDDGVRVPDGVYEVVVHAVTAAGDEGTASVLRGIYSGPVVEFTAPVDGASVSGSTTLAVQLDPGFLAHFTPDRVGFSCGNGAMFGWLTSTNVISPDGEASVTVDLEPCDVGPGEIATDIRYTDELGGRDEILFAARRSIVIGTAGPFAIALAADVPTEGWSYTFEGLAVRGCVTRVADLTVTVRDGAGTVVRDLSPSGTVSPSDCTAPPTFATWDHRDASGSVVPDGTYEIEVVAVDASGTEDPPPTASVALTRQVVGMPVLEVSSPAPGALLSGPTTIVVARPPGADPGLDLGVIIDCPGGPGPGSLAWTSLPAGMLERSIPVDVQACGDGPQELTITAAFLDPAGQLHFSTTPLPVTVFHPTLSPGIGEVVEGHGGSAVVQVPVRLSAPSPFPVTATWRAVDGTASAGVDFATVASGTVTFAPGQTLATVPITVHGDTVAEVDEMVFVRFARPDRARLGGFFGVGFAMVDDDDSGPRARLGTVTLDEGDAGTTSVASLPITLSEPSAQPVTVTWRTLDHGATAPGDYTAASGTVTFAPGETQATIDLTVAGDAIDEPDELFAVALTGATGGSVGGWLGVGFVTISDDD